MQSSNEIQSVPVGRESVLIDASALGALLTARPPAIKYLAILPLMSTGWPYLPGMVTDEPASADMLQIRRHVLSLVKTGAFTRAVTVAAEFARRNPDMAESHGLLSQVEEIAGYTKAAIKTVSHAIALAPQEPAYRFQRGLLHLKVNAVAAALEDMASVIEMEKCLTHPYYTEAALSCREEVLGQQQHHPVATSSARNPAARVNRA